MITLNNRFSLYWRLPATAYRGAQWYETPADSVTHAEQLALSALEQGADVVELYQCAPFYRLLQTFTVDNLEAA